MIGALSVGLHLSVLPSEHVLYCLYHPVCKAIQLRISRAEVGKLYSPWHCKLSHFTACEISMVTYQLFWNSASAEDCFHLVYDCLGSLIR